MPRMESPEMKKKRQTRAWAIAAIAIALFVALSIFQFARTHPAEPSPTDGEATQEEVIERDQGSVDQDDQGSASTEEADVSLSEYARAAKTSYDQETQELIGILSQNAWGAPAGGEVSFTDSTYRETASGAEPEDVPYAILALKSEQVTDSGRQIQERTAAMETPAGITFLTLTRTVTIQGEEAWEIESPAFQNKGRLVRAQATGPLTIEAEALQELAPYLGGSAETLNKLLTDYCSLYYPSASHASWSKQIDIDADKRTLTTVFNLDNASHTHLKAIYHTDTQSYEFG